MKKITLAEGTTLEITDEAYQALLDANKKGRWRAEDGDQYWTVTASGDVFNSREDRHAVDNFRYLNRSYFRTEKEAQAHLDRLLAIARVSDAIDEKNGGWVPDWEDESMPKYEIAYDHDYGRFVSDDTYSWQLAPILPYIKSKEIANEIIKEHEADLKVIFGIK